ncbi:MAG: LAGLIDADG family homing endonuclease [Nanoarchaeota archaeon]|nr:LAGLIDADG family homing endonuclease [Nanoarchaeota archaeon]
MEDYKELLLDSEKTKALVRVVAHLMGDGCVTNKYFSYYNKNDTLLNGFEKDLIFLFGNIHLIKGKVNSGTRFIMVQNKPIHTFLKSLLADYRSFALYMPKFIDRRELYVEFLRTIYDDEGCAALRLYKKTNEIKRSITLSSNSKRLLEEIKVILENEFAIKSNKLGRYDRRRESKVYTNYVLTITAKSNIEKFRDTIGFSHPAKVEKLDRMIKSYIRLAATK